MFKRHKINNKIKTRLQNLLYLRDFEKLFSSSTVIAIFSFLKLKKMRASKKRKADDSRKEVWQRKKSQVSFGKFGINKHFVG